MGEGESRKREKEGKGGGGEEGERESWGVGGESVVGFFLGGEGQSEGREKREGRRGGVQGGGGGGEERERALRKRKRLMKREKGWGEKENASVWSELNQLLCGAHNLFSIVLM